MYVVVVLLQTLILPLGFGIGELAAQGGDAVPVIGSWFLFWGVGTRLLLAGAHQVLRPEYTAEGIMGTASADATHLAQELGFANLCMGLAAVVAFTRPEWWLVGAIPGGLFLLLAGLRHVAKPGKGREELVATWTDLLVGVAMVVLVGWQLASA
ncbi:MAG: DUF6790 family protein [Chloroflexota bacterium]